MNLSPILIRVKASARRINQLNNCVLPCKALCWPYTVPREILLALAFYKPLQKNSFSSRKSTQQRASKFLHPFPLQRHWQISSITSPYALCKIFSPITCPSRGIRWLLCECELVTIPKVFKFLTTIRHFQASQPLFGKSDRKNRLFKCKI